MKQRFVVKYKITHDGGKVVRSYSIVTATSPMRAMEQKSSNLARDQNVRRWKVEKLTMTARAE